MGKKTDHGMEHGAYVVVNILVAACHPLYIHRYSRTPNSRPRLANMVRCNKVGDLRQLLFLGGCTKLETLAIQDPAA